MKSLEKRLKECIAIRAQLRLYLKDDSECTELIDAMNVFVKDGVASTGSLFVSSLGKKIQYMLSTKHDSFAIIKGGDAIV